MVRNINWLQLLDFRSKSTTDTSRNNKLCCVHISSSYYLLFHCHTLRQISRLVHVQTLGNRYIVAKQLQRNHCQTTNKVLVHLWNINCEVYLIFGFILAISSEPHQISTTALALQHIADSLFVEFALGQHADDQRSLLNQTNSSVLQFASCICLRVNVADFFQFQTTFQADSIVNATTHEEHIVCIGILCCKPLDALLIFQSLLHLLRKR